MRQTLVLTVEKDLFEFFETEGTLDPSALINKLFHDDMDRKHIKIDPALKDRMEDNKVLQEAELLLDESTFAGD